MSAAELFDLDMDSELGSAVAANGTSAASTTAGTPRGTKRPANTQGRASSCAECRRLKLKCDRADSDTWPCFQCRRRKCAELCPGSVSTPTAKAGNEKLLRHYRSKIAELEAQLSKATAQQRYAQTGASHSPQSSASASALGPAAPGGGATAATAPAVAETPGVAPPGSSTLPAASSRHPDGAASSSPVQRLHNDSLQQSMYDEAQLPNRRVHQPDSSVSAALDETSVHSSYESVEDQSYWPDDEPLPAPASSSTAHRPADIASSTGPTAPVAVSEPVLMQAIDDEDATQPSQPSGPTYFGNSAGALYCQPDLENLFEASPLLTTPQLQQSAMQVLPPTLWQAQQLLSCYESRVAWMYAPVDAKTLSRTLQQLYSGSAVMTEPRLSMILLSLSLGALFDGGVLPQPNPLSSPYASLHQQQQQSQQPRRPHINENRPHADHFGFSLGAERPRSSATNSQSQRIFQLGFKIFLRQSSALSVFAPCVWESAVSAHLAVSYLLSCGQADTSHAAWQVLGSGIRMAVSMGLHCSQSTWNLPPEQASAHARVWWELQAYERLQSLNFGRPSCLPEYVGCRPPIQLPSSDWQSVKPNIETFHAIKYQLGPLYAKINQLHSKEEPPAIAQVMSIDAEIRSFMRKVPSWLLLDDNGSAERYGQRNANLQHILPQKHMLSLLFHKAILFLHRPFFCKAAHSSNEPLLSPYASSFAAAIGSARQHTMLFKSALATCPSALKWWFFLFHLYTAAALQAQVLLRCPSSMLATEVQTDLELSYSLLTTAASESNVARRASVHIGSLRSKILRSLGAQSARSAAFSSYPAGTPVGSDAARTGLDALSEAAAVSSRSNGSTTSIRPSLVPMTTSEGVSAQSTAPTTLSPASQASLAVALQSYSSDSSTAWAPSSVMSFQQSRQNDADRMRQQDSAFMVSDPYPGLSNLSAILESENLPPEFESGQTAQWAWMDPLLQSTLFWHTASGGSTNDFAPRMG